MGQSVLLQPLRERAIVRSIDINDQTVEWAAAGDHALITVTGVDPDHVAVGSVLCDDDATIDSVAASRCFEVQLVVFDIQMPILQGSTVIVQHRSVDVQAIVKRLKRLLDKSTGASIKQNPRVLTKNSMAMVDIELCAGERSLCVDSFKRIKDMGRITVRRGGETIAAGIITQPQIIL